MRRRTIDSLGVRVNETFDLLLNVVPPLLGALLMIWAGAIVYRALWPSGVLRGGASCGRCGYAITAPIPARCPECGGELAEVGLATAALATRLRGGLFRVLLAWLVLAFLAGVPLRGLTATALMNVLPRTRVIQFGQTFTVLPGGATPQKPFAIQTRGVLERRLSSPMPGSGHVTLTFFPRFVAGSAGWPPQEVIGYSITTGSYEVFSDRTRVKAGPDLTIEDVEALLGRLEPSMPGEQRRTYARGIRPLARMLAESGELPFNGAMKAFDQARVLVEASDGSMTSSETARARLPFVGPVDAATLAWAAPLALMIVGGVLVARRYRRLTRVMRTKGVA